MSTKPSSGILAMDKDQLAKIFAALQDLESDKDDAGMALASKYKDFKKKGINIDALKLARRIDSKSPQHLAAFLEDFDAIRRLRDWDAQFSLFQQEQAKLKAGEATEGGGENVEAAGESKPVIQAAADALKAADPAHSNVVPMKRGRGRPKGSSKKPKPTAAEPPAAAQPSAAAAPAIFKDDEPEMPDYLRRGAAAAPPASDPVAEDDGYTVEQARELGFKAGYDSEDDKAPFDKAEAPEHVAAWHAGWAEGQEKLVTDRSASPATQPAA